MVIISAYISVQTSTIVHFLSAGWSASPSSNYAYWTSSPSFPSFSSLYSSLNPPTGRISDFALTFSTLNSTSSGSCNSLQPCELTSLLGGDLLLLGLSPMRAGPLLQSIFMERSMVASRGSRWRLVPKVSPRSWKEEVLKPDALRAEAASFLAVLC